MNAVSSAIELTRTLIRFNTVNPPGEERACAKHLGALLEDAGFSVSYQEFAGRRASLVARLGGSADKPPLCFTGHIDTVALGAAPWAGDPSAPLFSPTKIHNQTAISHGRQGVFFALAPV